MSCSVLYLNRDGSRWISKDRSRDKIQIKYPDGTYHLRQVDWWESFGNFACAVVRVRGRRIRLLASETEPCKDGHSVYNLDAKDLPPLKSKEPPAGEKLLAVCGHPIADCVEGDEGTCYCKGCEDAARATADLDATLAAEKFEEENL